MQDFRRDYVKEHLKDMTLEEIREAFPPEKLLKGLSPEDRLKGLSEEEREALFKLLKSQQQQSPVN